MWNHLVGSCKKAMMGVLDGHSSTDDVLITFVCLVEQTLRARQLTSVKHDTDDMGPLTPNHFVLGKK